MTSPPSSEACLASSHNSMVVAVGNLNLTMNNHNVANLNTVFRFRSININDLKKHKNNKSKKQFLLFVNVLLYYAATMLFLQCPISPSPSELNSLMASGTKVFFCVVVLHLRRASLSMKLL